jgi:hypothetical protein
MLGLAHSERGTEHFFLGLSPNLEAEEKKGGGRWGGVKNPRCEAATICGGRPGFFFPANDADAASQPMNRIE